MKKIACFISLFIISHHSFGQLNPFSAGSLNPGDSIVIYYDVTINTLCGCTMISNQGTVSGSNFVTLSTDDPDTAPAADATITLLNLFPLPVTLTSVKAVQNNSGIEVSWLVSSEYNMVRYEIERSSDGILFSKIGEVTALNNPYSHTYIFQDAQPFAEKNYYRLRLLELSPVIKYSSIVMIDMKRTDISMNIYPNPVRERVINIQMNNFAKGSYTIHLYNAAGQVEFTGNIYHDGRSSTQVLVLSNDLPPGTHYFQLNGRSGKFIKSLLIQ